MLLQHLVTLLYNSQLFGSFKHLQKRNLAKARDLLGVKLFIQDEVLI